MSSTTIYCTYLTCYKGKGGRLPPFYIGSTTVKKVESGYHGSVASKKYKAIWKNELKEHPELFKTQIISLHETGEAARAKELKLQRALKVVESSLYINQAYASVNGYFGVIVTGKDHPSYGTRPNEETRKKLSASRSGEKSHRYGKTGEKNPGSISFYAVDPDGTEYIVTGIRQFARIHNLTATNIINVLKGRAKHHKNWTFGYMEKSRQPLIKKIYKDISEKKPSKFDYSIYKFFNTETKETFEGLRSEFVRKYNLLHSGVYRLIINEHKHHRKWCLVEKRESNEKIKRGYDQGIYKFFNIKTQETFEGHRAAFIHEYNLSNDGVSRLIIKKGKHHRNWILVEKIS